MRIICRVISLSKPPHTHSADDSLAVHPEIDLNLAIMLPDPFLTRFPTYLFSTDCALPRWRQVFTDSFVAVEQTCHIKRQQIYTLDINFLRKINSEFNVRI